MRTTVLALGLLLALSLPVLPTSAQDQPDATYTVQDGDTLYDIAQDVGVSVRTLMKWNGLDEPTIQVGQTLRVRPPKETAPSTAPPSDTSNTPNQDTTHTTSSAAPSEASSSNESARDAPRPYGRYAPTAGDTFVNLALRLGTTADSLFALNDSTSRPLSPDSALRLPRRFGPPTHVVEAGQTLYSIAGQYGVSVRSLKVKNELASDTLQPGQSLQIPRQAGVEMPAPGTWAAPDTTGRVARYPEAFAGRLTASGTAYDPEDLVISHPSLPFNSVVLLTTPSDDAQTFARVIDRGPIEEGTLLDVSNAVAEQLALGPDPPKVALRVVWRERDAQ